MFKFLEKCNFISWIVTIVIAIIIFYLSSLSFQQGTIVSTGGVNSYLYHFFAFFLFAFFLMISLIRGRYNNLIFLAIVTGVLYGISDEFHQLFVPNRTCTLADMLTDSLGVLSASLIYLIFRLQDAYKPSLLKHRD
jgi:hypothetical protein